MRHLLVTVVFLLTGCSGGGEISQIPATLEPATPATAKNTREFGPSVAGGEEAEVVYQLLVGEIAGQRGLYGVSAEYYLAAAKQAHDPKLAERAARIALYAGDEPRSLVAAEYWRELEPDRQEVYRLLVNLHVRAGNQADAAMALTELLRLSGEEPDYSDLMELLAQFPDPDLAGEVLAGLLEQRGDEPAVLAAYAALALRSGNYAVAEDALQRVLAMRPDWPRALELYVETLVQLRHTQQAQEFLLTRLQADPSQDALRMQLARVYLVSREPAKAVTEFETLLAHRPDDSVILYPLARLSLELERVEVAEGYFRQLAEQGSEGNDARYYLGQIAERRQQPLAAIDWYRQVYEGNHAFGAKLRLARLMAETGEPRRAVSELHLAHPVNPQQRISLLLAEADILHNAGATAEALEVLGGGLQSYPEDIDLLYGRAMVAGELNRLDLLEADLRKVVEMEPENVHALNALGYTLADKTQRYQEALGYITRAIELSPDNPFVLDSLGWVYYRLGRHEQAVQCLSRALNLMPGNEITAHLGEVLWVMGREGEARALLDDGLEKSPDDSVLLEVLERLGQ